MEVEVEVEVDDEGEVDGSDGELDDERGGGESIKVTREGGSVVCFSSVGKSKQSKPIP